MASADFEASNQGKRSSSTYTSDVTTVRFALGTQILYAPGERTLRPRLTPSHARASIVVLEYATRGLSAYARQPNGSMLMLVRGLIPVSSSYDDASVLGGPQVRFRMSTAWVTAESADGRSTGGRRDARVSSIIEQMARSATPLS
eukprot:3900225-Pleurochrysis_carterae.AAC.2